MHVVARIPRQTLGRGRRMYSPRERGLVRNDMGLGEVDGLFNIGKMFTRMFTFTPSSFKLSNIMGAIGSATMFTASGGLVALAPKVLSAHSTIAKDVGMATVAVAAVAGGAALLAAPAVVGGGAATGVGLTTSGSVIGGSGIVESAGSSTIAGALAPEAAGSGFFGTVGSVFSTVGSGLMNVVKGIGSILPVAGQLLGGSGGQQQGQQQQFGPTQPTADQLAQQAAYDAQVRAQQAAMYSPGYSPSIPYVTGQYPGSPVPTMDSAYGDLRSPYTAIAEDGSTVQVDPATGQIITPMLTTPMLVGGGALVLLLGWYFMSDE